MEAGAGEYAFEITLPEQFGEDTYIAMAFERALLESERLEFEQLLWSWFRVGYWRGFFAHFKYLSTPEWHEDGAVVVYDAEVSILEEEDFEVVTALLRCLGRFHCRVPLKSVDMQSDIDIDAAMG